MLYWPKHTQINPFPVKKQQQCTTTLATSIQNSRSKVVANQEAGRFAPKPSHRIVILC